VAVNEREVGGAAVGGGCPGSVMGAADGVEDGVGVVDLIVLQIGEFLDVGEVGVFETGDRAALGSL